MGFSLGHLQVPEAGEGWQYVRAKLASLEAIVAFPSQTNCRVNHSVFYSHMSDSKERKGWCGEPEEISSMFF